MTKVKVSSTDSTTQFLEDKVAAGEGVAVSKISSGGIEYLEISATSQVTQIANTVDGYQVLVSVDDTDPAFLSSKISAGSNVELTIVSDGGSESIRIDAVDQIDLGALTFTDGYNLKITTSDIDPGFLAAKLVAGANISLTVISDGGAETLQVEAAYPDLTAINDDVTNLDTAIQTILSDLDGYVISAQDYDGYVSFFTGTAAIAGDNDLFWNRAANKLETNRIDLRQVKFESGLENPTWEEGLVFYDNTEKALSLYNDQSEVTHQLGQEQLVRARNNSGATIDNGKVVYVTGASGNRPTIGLAQANTDILSAVIGVATHDISNNDNGFVTTAGIVNDIPLPTATFSDGDLVYLSTTSAGDLTTTKPDCNGIVVEVGVVLLAHNNNGKLLVHVKAHSDFNDLHGVSVDNATNGNIIIYDETQEAWLAVSHGLDGYALATTENQRWTDSSQQRQDLRNAADGYSTLTTAQGSDGYIAFFTGANALAGDNDLFYDRANSRLGLNTTSPAERLDVNGNVRVPSTSSSAIQFGESNTGLFSDASGNLTLETSGTNVFIADANGLVMGANSTPELKNSSGSPTSPTILPNKSASNVGLAADAGIGDSQLSLIAGGIEGMRIAEESSVITISANGVLNASSNANVTGTLDVGGDIENTHLQNTLDGYTTSAQGADGYIAFFTGSGAIAGDNDLFYNRATGDLTLGSGGDIVVNTGGRVKIADGSAASPSICFTDDTDTGIYSSASNTINFTAGGSAKASISSNGIELAATGSPRLINTTGSATQATVIPNRSDSATGLGLAATSQLSLIAGGTEGMRLSTEDGVVTIDANGILNVTSNANVTGTLDVGGDIENTHLQNTLDGYQQRLDIVNCSIVETIDIDVTSDGATVTFSVQADGGGDLTVLIDGGITQVFDSTPAATISLIPGSDTSPTLNYVYILISNNTLTVSTVDFPSAAHSPLATVLVQSESGVQSDGAYKVHAWTNHLSNGGGCGHLAGLNFWIRQQQATWSSGVSPTATGDIAVFDFAVTSGNVLQLHPHSYPALDTAGGDDVFIVNDFTTAYKKVGDLTGELTDSANVSMSGKSFFMTFWGVVSEKEADSKLMCNLPSGSYNNPGAASGDPDGTSVFTIPSAFTGTGFLIARVLVSHSAGGAGTWTIESTEDLRGQFPSQAAGSTLTSTTIFPDNQFQITDDGDNTKVMVFQASGITTGTTRTITVPDSDVTLVGGHGARADGYLAFWTGSDELAGDNDLYYDRVNSNLIIGSDGKLGINVTPGSTTALDVQGAGTDTRAQQWRSSAGVVSAYMTPGGILRVADGSLSAPGIAFSDDTNTGIRLIGAGNIAVTANAVDGITLDEADGYVTSQFSGQGWSDIADTITTVGSEQTLNLNASNSFVIDLEEADGDVSLLLTNPKAGASYVIQVIQDSASAKNVTWEASVLHPGGIAPVISTGANDIDIISLFYNGTNYFTFTSQDFS